MGDYVDQWGQGQNMTPGQLEQEAHRREVAKLKHPCPKCGIRESYPRYDRHNIYSGRACDECADQLPGQGCMWDYQAEEPIEDDY